MGMMMLLRPQELARSREQRQRTVSGAANDSRLNNKDHTRWGVSSMSFYSDALILWGLANTERDRPS